MKNKINKIIYLTILLFFNLGTFTQIIYEDNFFVYGAENIGKNLKILNIKISGNLRYNEYFYKSLLKSVKLGSNFNNELKNKVIKEIFATDYVNNVKVYFNDNILYINIEEKNFIKKITVNGNKKLKDSVIKENFKLKVKNVFSYNLLNHDLEFIDTFYKSIGFYNAKVSYEIKYEDNNLVEVIFNIEENKKSKVGKIYFVGNNNIGSSELKEHIFSREKRFFRLFGRSTLFNPDVLEYNSYLIKNYYLKKGYLNFRIVSQNAKYNKKNKTFDLIYIVEENEKFYFGDMKIINRVKDLDTKKLENILKKLKKGNVFNVENLQGVVNSMNNSIDNNKFAIINPQFKQNNAESKMDIDFIIDSTKHKYFGKIVIKNNTRTYDSTIREQLNIREGDAFNKKDLERSIQKIKNLGFFKDVSYTTEEGIFENQTDVVIDVEETASGSFNFGISYSSIDRISGNIGVSQRNLFGRAINFNFDIYVNEYYKNFSFDFIKPNFAGTNTTLGTSLFFQDYSNTKNSHLNIGYDEFSTGASVFVSYNLSEYLSQTIKYSYKFEKLKNLSIDYQRLLTTKKQQISELSVSFSYDRRDNRYDTTSGYILNYSLDFAGILGTKDYLRNTIYFAYYYPLYSDKLVMKFETKLARIISINNNPLFPSDGFYLGGYSMRGFESAGIGPKIIDNSNNITDTSVGGTKLFYSNLEIKFPFFTPREFNLFGIFFINAGSVSGIENNPEVDKNYIKDKDSIRSAYGFALLWKTPMGNMSFDFSRTLKKEDFDLDESFAFNIGKSF